jgi:hypothetical protein
MPLQAGGSSKVVSSNIKELMQAFASKGSIGTSHPKNKKAAQRQAVAIALSQKRKSLAHGG